jgi:tRNA 2-selenouridine synthase
MRGMPDLLPVSLYPVGGGEPPLAIIDVRSPVELDRGSLPWAHALPLLSDAERHEVGLRYAEAGQEAAVALGWEITRPLLEDRIAAWRRVASRGPTAVVCWRGGLRSALATRLIDSPSAAAVAGGYRAVRRHLIDALPAAVTRSPLLVLTGLTGAGKTELLRRLGQSTAALQLIDLEALARHRGSSFGATEEPQPPQASFENAIACQLLLHRARAVMVEDESRYVGRRTLPPALHGAMQAATLVVLEADREERIARLFEAYVRAPALSHGVAATRASLEASVLRLRRRLGGGRTSAILDALRKAEPEWLDPGAHRGWIGLLLEQYYDRLYERNRAALARPVMLRGDADELLGALPALAATLPPHASSAQAPQAPTEVGGQGRTA